jgi:hypothetical protein
MPEREEYLKGYNLHEGMQLAGFTLKHIDLKHETITRYREYHYPIVMIWESQGGNSQELIRALDDHVKQDRTIYTKYGNPYECHFGTLQHHYQNSQGELVVNSMGVCRRV